MNKRVFIIHGWGGNPNKDWIPWVVLQLKRKGFEVFAPFIPDTDSPQIKPWIAMLQKIVGDPKADDIFIGHSIGCQTILRYLEKLKSEQKIDKVIMVAPWFILTNLENDESWIIADPWLKTSIDLSKVKPKVNSFTAIFSDNDAWVPLKENEAMFKDKLDSKVIILNNKGHFSEEEGVKELPTVLTSL